MAYEVMEAVAAEPALRSVEEAVENLLAYMCCTGGGRFEKAYPHRPAGRPWCVQPRCQHQGAVDELVVAVRREHPPVGSQS